MDKYLEYSDMREDKLQVVKNCMDLAPKGNFLEIGTRRGGTALMALQHENCELLTCVDPYLPFLDKNGDPIEMDENWYQETMDLLNSVTPHFSFWKNTSDEFMKLAPKRLYSYVLLDGAHVDDIVGREIEYFKPKMKEGGIILVDNIDWLTLDFTGWEKPRFDMAYFIKSNL